MRKQVEIRKQLPLSEVKKLNNILDENINDLTPEGILMKELINTVNYWVNFGTNAKHAVKVRNKYLNKLGYKVVKGPRPLKKIKM